MPIDCSVATSDVGQKRVLVLQRVQNGVFREGGWWGGGVGRRLVALVKKQIYADSTVRGKAGSFFLPRNCR